MGTMFGGGGQTSTTTTTQELSPEQQRLMKLVIPTAEQFIQNPPTLFGTGGTITNPEFSSLQQEIAGLETQLQGTSQFETGFTGVGGRDREARQRVVNPEFASLQNQLSALQARLAGLPETLPGGEPRSAIQPFDPLQLQAQENLLALAGPGGGLPALTEQAGEASQFLLGPVLFPESNPALAAATEAAIRPLTEQFQNVILPGIRGEAITAGAFGGSRQGIAEGLAAQGLTRQTGDITASIQADAFQQSLDAMTRALFAAPSTAQLQFLPTAATGAVGAQRQQMEQALLSEEAQRFISEQLIPFATAQDVAALAFGIPGGSVTSTSELGGGGGGGLGSALGIAALLASLALPGAGTSLAGAGTGGGSSIALML